jgi:tripartite-type tricarboxylate transporter receptor subunit TctC
VPPDGYQLLFTITTHIQTPVVMRRFPYDPVADFAPIGRLGSSNTAFVVGPKVPAEVTTMAEFVRWAAGRDLSFGSYASGSTGHAFALMLAEEARLRMEHVAYRGETPMLQEMLSGSIHGGWHSMAAAGEMMHARRIRPLAASGAARIPSLPEVPTMTELGYSGRFRFAGFSGLLAPARTPQPILDHLAEVFRIAATKPTTLARLRQIDTIPSYQGPAEFRAQIERNLREWTAITNALDLRMEG